MKKRLLLLALIVPILAGCGTKKLVSHLLADDPDTRGKALSRLPTLSEPMKQQIAPLLVGQLTNPDTRLVNRAVDALSVLHEAAVPALISATKNPDPFARISAAQALGLIGESSKDAIPDLITLLSDSHPLVRDEAATALGYIGPTAAPAVPALIKALKDETPDVRLSAADALSKIDTPEAKAALAKLPKPKKAAKTPKA